MEASNWFQRGAVASLAILILWLLAWELFVAPLHPGGSVLALKAVPLLLPLLGAFRRDIYTMQWSSMVILLYFTEGVVRAWSDKVFASAFMAGGEVVLVAAYFACTILYLRPYKRAASKMAKELIERVNNAK